MTGDPRLPYRLVLDLQATQSTEHADRGIARYALETTRALLRLDPDLVGRIVLNPLLPFPKRLPPDLLSSPLLAWNTASELRRTAMASDRALAYHVLSPFELSHTSEGDLPPHAVRREVPLVATLYDLIPLVMTEKYLHHSGLERRYRARLEVLHEVDLVVTISEHTRRDALEHLGLRPERVRVIGAGVSSFFRPPLEGEQPRRLVSTAVPGLDRPYVLTVLGGDARKNAEGLLSAWARVSPEVREQHQLVVACKLDESLQAAWAAHGEAEGLRAGDVVFTGWITDAVLRALYQAAELFVFPSLYEGFGLPAAEAVACGCPTVLSSTSSLPEVLDWPEATFDPTDVDSIAGVVERATTDEAFRSRLRARGAERAGALTWDAVARRLVDAAVEVLPPPPPGPTRLPLRLAVAGPLPPTLSGIADYNARLLPRLAARGELDLLTGERRRPETEALLPDARTFPPRAVGRTVNPHAYDALLYTVGNSGDHHDTLELARRWPGLLWLHDVRLPGLYITYARYRVDEDERDSWLAEQLEAMYGDRLPEGLEPRASDLPPDYAEAGLGMTRELVGGARAVIVSSELARHLLELDQGADAPLPPCFVVPLGAPDVLDGGAGRPAAAPDVLGELDGDGPVVACFGIVAPVKGTDTLIAALAHVRRRVPARVVFVGPVGEGYRAHLEDVAAVHGVAGAVHFTGEVPAAAFAAWLRAADVAVQLRTATYGESSAAVLDCLAAGLPVVTSVVSARELPPGTVELVPPDVDPEALAQRITRLLTDPDAHARLREAGLAYARSWDLDAVVDRLVAIVDELARLPSGPPVPPAGGGAPPGLR